MLPGCIYHIGNGGIKINIRDIQTNGAAQNLGLIDRTLRFFLGWAMLVCGYCAIERVEYLICGAGILLLSGYPLMTSILGWDPLFQENDSRSCNIKGRDELSGSAPLEAGAALYCELGHDHYCGEQVRD